MLIGKQVKLRLVEEEDLSVLVDWRNTPEIWAAFFNKFPLSNAGQSKWFANLVTDQTRQLFMICTIEDNKAIGTIGLDHIDHANQSGEFGNILIGETEYQGKGLALDATLTLLWFAFTGLNLNRIYLQVFSRNKIAVNLYCKCGFQKEGLLRQAIYKAGEFQDVVVMAILREEFLISQAASSK